MQIVLNGETTEIEEHASINDLLCSLGLQHQRVAVEVNQEVVPRSTHLSFILSATDEVEIIQAVGGG